MENEIFIRSLPDDFYVPELCDQFRRFGNIVSAWVQNHPKEAGVAFEEGCSALESVKRMDGKRVRGRNIEVTTGYEAQPFKTVFVKNFSPTWKDRDLIETFGQFGTVTSVWISESNCYGCVEYERHATAGRAIAAMNGTEIGGHRLVVERFKSKAERDHLQLNCLEVVEQRLRDSTQRKNLHVKNLPPDMEDVELRRLFQRFGPVLSAKVMTDIKGWSRGFGFVSFEREEDAARALRKMDGRSVRGGKILGVNFKEDGELRERLKRLKNVGREREVHNYKARSKSSTSLFVPLSVERNNIGGRLH